MSGYRDSSSASFLKWTIFTALIATWVVFAVDFVIRTSHVSIDGVRYFVIFDDVMIGMRYAKNLVEHHALVWNLGERVEGFSNTLWTLIMAVAIWLFGTHFAPLAMQIFGGLICLALFVFFFRFAARTKAGLLGAFVALAFLMLSYPLTYWGLGGMEACAVCLIYGVSIVAQYRYENRQRANPLLLHAGLIAVAYLLHPDAWLALVPFFAASWLDCVKERDYRRAAASIVIPCVVVAASEWFRVSYYGEWVPNTYVLKVQGYSLALRLKNGIAYLTPFFQENLGALALIALSAITRKKIAYLNILAVDILLVYQVYVGGDTWPYWRFVLPVYVATAFAIVLLFEYLRELQQATATSEPATPGRHTALIAALALLPCALFELVVLLRHIDFTAADRRIPMFAYFLAAAAAVLLSKETSSFFAANRPTLFALGKVLTITVAAYSVLLCDIPFKLDFGHHKPYVFDGEAHLIDKAVLANRLFGPGKTHHVVWAGAYGYYAEGTMIDSLGTCDKATARFPVNQNVSWDGMLGVPGHSKFDFRDSILQRKPDIVVERASWGKQDVSPEMIDRYVLVKSQGVSLCVKKELTAGLEPSLLSGNCPSFFFYTARK